MELRATELIKITGCDVLTDTVYLVDDQVEGFGTLAQIGHKRFITRMQTLATINQKQYNIGLFNGHPGLAGHGSVNSQLVATDAPGVDDNKRRVPDLALTVFSVPG